MNKKVTDMISAVVSFKGATAARSITAYQQNPFTMSKKNLSPMGNVLTIMPKNTFKVERPKELRGIYAEDLAFLPNVLQVPKQMGIDSIHAFLFVNNGYDVPKGIYAITEDCVFFYKELPTEDYAAISNTDGTVPYTNLFVVCSELNLKTDAFKELGYDLVMQEAGGVVQNLYRLQTTKPELYGVKTIFNVERVVVDKEAIIKMLGFTENNFIVCATLLLG